MDYAYRLLDNVRYFYKTLNPASLSGAIDLIVVEQPDGSYLSTPFHVRFGKYGVLNSDEKYVDITINGEEIDLKMKLGENGVAFFTEPTVDADVPEYLVTSPVPGSSVAPVDGKELVKRIEKMRRGLPQGGYSRVQSECSSSRSPSPPCDSGELIVKDRKSLPFKASLFSQRKNRSLPNLTELLVEQDDSAGKRAKDKRLSTVSYTVAPGRCLSPSSSATCKKHPSVSGKITFSSANEESDADDAASTFSMDSGASEQDHLKVPRLSMIADGALSDSELDRHRDTPEPHKSDVMVWKWGELPRTREETERTKEKQASKTKAEVRKTESTWSGWFRWSRTKPVEEQDQGVYLDDLVQNSSDPSKIEKYLGMSPPATCPSPPYDSGNGSFTGPSSPAKTNNENGGFVEHQHHGYTSKTITGGKKSADETNVLNSSSIGVQPSAFEPCTVETNKKHVRSATPSSDIFDEEGENPGSSQAVINDAVPFPKYIRSLRLSSDQLKKLGLRKGVNEARFSITTKFQGTTWCSCHIYLYKWTERLVISDIDGTITKSDVLGHVIPAIGGQWAHAGVAELYTRIKENGYQLVYLSSRAIGQSHYTKKYLQSIAQNAKFLPDGPLFLSPTSVLMAFRREVIDRKPEEFKIAALTDLKECFPVKQPFYAGFGNRETYYFFWDVVSYRAVDIPLDRILIIDKRGCVRRADAIGYETSFMALATDTVDYIFPPLTRRRNERESADVPKKNLVSLAPSFFKAHNYSDFTYWQSKPGQAIRLDDSSLESYEARRKKL